MKFTLAVAAAIVAGAAAHPHNGTAPVYVTEVVTALTTFCPSATEITHHGQTYTVTSATTLTITDCPCTITKPVVPAPHPTGNETHPAPPAPPAPTNPGAPPAGPPAGTHPVPTPPAGTPSHPAPPAFTGAAQQLGAQAGSGVAALLAAAAYML